MGNPSICRFESSAAGVTGRVGAAVVGATVVVVDVVAEVISAVQTPIKASGTCQQLRNSLGFRLDWVKSCL